MKGIMSRTALLAGVLGMAASTALAQREGLRQDGARAGKDAGVSFRLASATPARGYEAVTVGRDETLYVSPVTAIAPGDIVSTESLATRSGSDMSMTLTAEAAARLGDVLSKQPGDRVALYVSGQAVVSAGLRFDSNGGVATITGLSAAQAERVSSLMTRGSGPSGPTLTAVASRAQIMPGETVNVDIYVSGVNELRTYQLTVDVTGGTAGALNTSDLWVTDSRPDFVFGNLQKLDGMDKVGSRIGVVLMSGSVNAEQSHYVGTFALTASDHASGAFRVNVSTGVNTGLWDAATERVAFSTGADTVITVGSAAGIRETQK
jgi:hypothetical protein